MYRYYMNVYMHGHDFLQLNWGWGPVRARDKVRIRVRGSEGKFGSGF